MSSICSTSTSTQYQEYLKILIGIAGFDMFWVDIDCYGSRPSGNVIGLSTSCVRYCTQRIRS